MQSIAHYPTIQQEPGQAMKIGINPHLWRLPRDKAEKDYMAATASANGWQECEMSINALAAHLDAGRAIGSLYRNGHRSKPDFIALPFIAIDFDGNVSPDELARHPLFSIYTAIIGATPSHSPTNPHSRAIIPLAPHRADYATSKRCAGRVLAQFEGADQTSDQPERFYFGFQTGLTRLMDTGRLLTVEDMEALPPSTAEIKAAEAARLWAAVPRRVLSPTSSRAEKYAAATLEGSLRKLETTPAGERNQAIFRTAASLMSKALGQWPGITASGIESAITAIIERWGNPSKSHRTMHNGFRDAKPEALELPTRNELSSRGDNCHHAVTTSPARVIHPANLPPFTADLTVNVQYITELDATRLAGRKTIALKSATGTGKTEFVARLIKSLPDDKTVLALTHRVALVDSNARRLATLHYHDEFGDSAPRIASTVDSLHRQHGRTFDVLFIDEAAQVLRHFASAGTMRERTIALYETFKQLITSAGAVILADANLNDDVIEFFRALRPDVYTVENTYQPQRADTVLLNHHLAAVQEAVNRVGENKGVILIPCAAQRDARKLHKELKRLYPDKRGQIITARNSETVEVKQFVADINERLSELAWLIYTSSMGTGVDIQCPVYAVVGLFGQPIAPADAMQMMGRARNATHRVAYAPDSSGGGETDPDKLLSYQLMAADETTRSGAPAPDAHTRGLARLKATTDARQNGDMADYLDTFAAYLAKDGSTPRAEARALSSAMKADWKALGESEKALEKELALNAAPVSNDALDKWRTAGRAITDEIHAGNKRWKIEDISGGLTINSARYDLLHTPQKMRQQRRFESLVTDEPTLKERDQSEATERLPLHRRRNWNAQQRLAMDIIYHVFGVRSIEALKSKFADMPADELSAKCADIGRLFLHRMKALLGYREAHDAAPDNAIGLLRWVFRKFGLAITRKRIRHGDVLIYAYSLDASGMDTRLEIARHHIAAQQGMRNVPESSMPLSQLTKWEQNRHPAYTAPDPTPPDVWICPPELAELVF